MKKFLGLALVLLVASVAHGQTAPVTIRVRNFGNGMTPVLPPFRNDPEAVVFSQNMYSTNEGGRQVRFGISRIDTLSPSDSVVRSLVFFTPRVDSGRIVYTAGRKWYGNTAGVPRGAQLTPWFSWDDFLNAANQIRPFAGGDSVGYAGDSVIGFKTFFTRDVSIGDTIEISSAQREVKFIRSDNKLFVTSTWGGGDTTNTYTLSRSYPTGATPFLMQSGDLLYTGTGASEPQVIYLRNGTARIRHLGIVDSIYIDTVYYKYPATAALWDSVPRRSWDTIYGLQYFKEFQIVSRRKPGQWLTDQWREAVNESPEAYYVRIGYEDKTAFYPITGNSDTSIYLGTWYLDSTGAPGSEWSDTSYFNVAQDQSDFVSATSTDGKYAYIYCATGFSNVVVHDTSTGTVKIRGRGALFWTIDATPPIDSTAFYKAMHFIHLTGDDVAFDQYSDSSSKLIREITRYTDVGDAPFDTTGATDYFNIPVWTCGRSKYYSSYEEAVKDCPPNKFGTGGPEQRLKWTIRTTRTDLITKEAEFVGNSYFPIRYMSKKGDTLFFVTAVGTDLTSNTDVSTVNWEIVKVGLPRWTGMAEWNTPPQLVAWGDTNSASLLSFSGVNDPWNWSVNNDVLVGARPSDPIVSVVGYDDQLVVFKPTSIVGYDGLSFKELSQTDGLVGRRAVVGLTKELYWQDVDGFKKMQRRDFSGYSIQKISTDIDPAVNSWSAIQFGADQVPFIVNPAYRGNTVLSYNQRDNHLYVFGTFGSATKNNACLTLSLDRNIWDGYFTIGAMDAVYTTIRDTARIIIGSPDSASVYALGYNYNDFGNKISTDLRSAKFFVTDERGMPYVSKFLHARLLSKSVSGALDSGYVMLIGSTQTDTLDLTGYPAGTAGFKDTTYYSSIDNVSTYWQWEIKTYGTAAGGIFQPQELVLVFQPIAKDIQ